MKRFGLVCAGLLVSVATAAAGEKGLMHCFAFTPVATATEADWAAFGKTTDALPGKVKGLKRVWRGKLLKPMQNRQNAVCMEFQDEAAFKAYDADPAHKAWVDVYSKVRTPGTTTYQIVGE